MKAISKTFLILLMILSGVYSFSQKSLSTSRLEHAPEIDGKFDPVFLNLADSATGFIQMEPLSGKAATEKTVVYLGYHDEAVYVAIKCYQDPESIVAKIQTRDELAKDDDMIGVTLDTYMDKRTGFGFFVNPLGTQFDFRIGDDGRNIDSNWDTEWRSATRIYDWGWYAELEIPFSSLKYKRKSPHWGFNVETYVCILNLKKEFLNVSLRIGDLMWAG